MLMQGIVILLAFCVSNFIIVKYDVVLQRFFYINFTIPNLERPVMQAWFDNCL